MGSFQMDLEDAKRETLVLADTSFQRERPAVRDLLKRVQTLNTDEEYKSFQLDLLRRVKLFQDSSDELRRRERRTKARIRELAAESPKPIEALKEKGEELDLFRQKRRVVNALRWIHLGIGDALAWRVLGYDRGAIVILGQGVRVARFAAQEGFQAELEALDAWWADGKIAIHNDVTTCLRLGDITAVDGDANAVYLDEVKRTEQLTSTSPQVRRIEEGTRVIMEGRVEREGGAPMNLHRFEAPYRTHLQELQPLLIKARWDGYAAAKIGECYYVEATRFDVGLGEAEIAQRIERTRTADWWIDDAAHQVVWQSTHRRLRDRRHSHAGLAPLALYPLDYEDLTDLVMGFADVRVTMDIDCVMAAFREAGLEAKLPDDEDWGEQFLLVGRTDPDRVTTTVVGALAREQMLNELTTIESIVTTGEALLAVRDIRETEGALEEHAVTLADEALVWRATVE